MSFSNPTKTQEADPDERKTWEEAPTIFEHWYEAYQLGYKSKAWPKRYRDCDDDRFNLKEKENE
jgi:hypothetical protein